VSLTYAYDRKRDLQLLVLQSRACAKQISKNHITNMTTSEANKRLVGDLKTVAQDAEELMKATANHAGEKVVELRKRLSSALDSAKVTAQRLEEKTIEAAKATDRTIREHPYESIGIAFGVGLLIGVLVARR
jgi:ElaB/YqjD/DUF883 family membrane-anchored ribosome-binding protein